MIRIPFVGGLLSPEREFFPNMMPASIRLMAKY